MACPKARTQCHAGASPLLGLEAAGTILEVGAEAAGDFKPGERVMALCNGGTYAEQVLTSESLFPWTESFVHVAHRAAYSSRP